MTEHIKSELSRIADRLSGSPDPFEHAGLYAAQQALGWAAQPDAFASPYAVITGTREGRADYCSGSCPAPLPDTDAPSADAA